MKELLILLAKNLVDQPDMVEVTEEENDGITTLRLKVAPDDMGKVIGKQGRIARAVRTLVKAAAIHEEKKVNVEII
ncbi:MAG: KH domain-containing protein [Defluviitaleaceae bacterium]|nr:KH domain-containing protein [Defluviitaleaceae bacterium]